jgi:hypothetical protein
MLMNRLKKIAVKNPGRVAWKASEITFVLLAKLRIIRRRPLRSRHVTTADNYPTRSALAEPWASMVQGSACSGPFARTNFERRKRSHSALALFAARQKSFRLDWLPDESKTPVVISTLKRGAAPVRSHGHNKGLFDMGCCNEIRTI